MSDMAAKQEMRILVIEDNLEMRNLYKDVLEREGYKTFAVEDGEKGWTYVQSVVPDLVLLDINLPKMNGLEVLRRIRENKETHGVPVIIFSASAEAENVQNARRLGVNDFTMKAIISPKQMLVKIRDILEKHPSQKAAQGYELPLHDGKVNVAKFQEDLGIRKDSLCLHCKGILLLNLRPDPTRTDGHWFLARLVCSGCNRVY